ncbi:hypothetical protein MAFF211479_25860 [Ralstonia solanacearum]|nr:hypothetical protein MAFF211479_25860 [Ralstonia solanacearum]BCL96734.1 hypothetical protein MAFF211491_11860 [Ralstonia solanacearum]BCM12047.1 hypothetical protein MAFF241648_12370 [Ralstonia solanacearum]BCN05451.1 hypothetical protein RPSB_25880 [Ralstonia solanacearum]
MPRDNTSNRNTCTRAKRHVQVQANEFDPSADMHERLDAFLKEPTKAGTLQSLIAGLVDWELRARLTEVLPPA